MFNQEPYVLEGMLYRTGHVSVHPISMDPQIHGVIYSLSHRPQNIV